MKKLMIAAAIVCAAAMAQATAVNWQQDVTQINGDWDEGKGDFAPAGWQMYLFDSNKAEGGTSYLQMQSLLAAATTEAGYANWLTAMDTKATIGTINSSQMLMVDGVEMTESASKTFTGYAVLIDADNISDAKYAFLVGEETWNKGASATAISFGEDFSGTGMKFINALDYSADPKTGWQAVGAVPEPTSGLLLLLGVAGLALRRRRA